jgi:hypothetical protein
MTLPPRLADLAHHTIRLTCSYSSTAGLPTVSKHWYQAHPPEHSHCSLLGRINNYGVGMPVTVAAFVAQKCDDAVLALAGVLHDAFTTTDHKSHATIMNWG